MGFFMSVLSVAQGVMGAMSSISQGRAQAASYQNQAAAAKYNAEVAAMNERIAGYEGTIARSDATAEAARAKGRQRAALAQSGILGSPTGNLLETASENEAMREQLNIQHKAGMEQSDWKSRTANYYNQASGYMANARSSRSGSYLGAFGNLLGGVAQGYDYYRRYN